MSTVVRYRPSRQSKLKTEAVAAAYNALKPSQQDQIDELADKIVETVRVRTGKVMTPFGSRQAAIELIGKLGMFLEANRG